MNQNKEEESNSQDKDYAEKIALIQREIIDQHLSSDNFNSFLKTKKTTDNVLMTEFSLEEINSYIAEFKEKERREMPNGGKELLPTIDQSIMLTESSQDFSDNDSFIITYKQPKSILSDYEHLTIIISNPIKVSSFVFFGVEYQFTIEVAELSSKVMRTLADFEFFKETLELYYTTTYIPPLPHMSSISSSNEDYFKRKSNYLLMFLNSLTLNPLVMSTQLFVDFLQMSEEDFEKVKNYYDEIDPPTMIKKFNTLEGLINISVEPKKEEYSKTIRNNILTKQKHYNKLNAALKDLFNEFNIISDKMNKVSIAFGDIAKSHDDIPFVQQTYQKFEELTKRYANSYLHQQLVFKEDIQQYLKFNCKYSSQFENVLNEMEAKRYDFEKVNVTPEKKCLLTKRELKKIDYLQKTYGYCLNKTIDEHKRLISIISESMRSHLQDINSKRDKLFGDYLSMASLLEIKNEEEEKVVN